MHLVGFITRIYHDARLPESQIHTYRVGTVRNATVVLYLIAFIFIFYGIRGTRLFI